MLYKSELTLYHYAEFYQTVSVQFCIFTLYCLSVVFYLFIHAYGSCGGTGFTSVCLFVCTMSQETDAARIIKLDLEMFHNESWKLIYFGIET